MSSLTITDLQAATQLLASKLIRPGAMDCKILDPRTFNNLVEVDEYFQQFIGLFLANSLNRPTFLLFGRSQSNGMIDHVFSFHINSNYRSFPRKLKSDIKQQISRNLKWFVYNVKTSSPAFCHLSVLSLSVEFQIGSRLFDSRPAQVIDAREGSTLVASSLSLGPTDCDLSKDHHEIKLFCQDLTQKGIKLCTLYPDRIAGCSLQDCDIFRLLYNNHMIYGIHYKRFKSLMLLLSHLWQIGDPSQVERLTTAIQQRFGNYKLRHIKSIRFFSSKDDTCVGLDNMRACFLSLVLPQVIIRSIDLISMFGSNLLEDLTQTASQTVDAFQESFQYSLADDESHTDDLVITSVKFDGPDGDPEVISLTGPYSSQETIIMSQTCIADEVKQHRIKLRTQSIDEILDQSVPPIHPIEAVDDSLNEYLNRDDVFLNGLDYTVHLWCRNTSFHIEAPLTIEKLSQGLSLPQNDAKFIVYPILDSGSSALLIISRKLAEWGYINPDGQSSEGNDVFKLFASCLIESCPELKFFKQVAISLTCYFHREYSRIHLIMATFQLARLLRYSRRIPLKIIYNERDFRLYCYRLCLTHQIACQEYNLAESLVKDTGYLRSTALVSHTSPVNFERSVVPMDQCPYCLKRFFKNLVRHIKMKHDVQARLAYLGRLSGDERDAYLESLPQRMLNEMN